jgi:D-glycero-alpha-D-manno-heptose 1-phosphate guanylyltransferase
MGDISGITVAILAGGLGTRLREAVADTPKVLAEVNGRPFLTYILDRLADAGAGRVVLCTGYLAERITRTLGGRYRNMKLLYSEEAVPLDTGGALHLALSLLNSDPVLVMNGDSFCDADLLLFTEQHRNSGAAASLVLAQVADVDRYGAVSLAPDNAITRFAEKGNRQGKGLINAGIYLFARSVIEAIPRRRAVSLERDVFPALIGHGLYGFPQKGRFLDIGIPDDFYAASALLQEIKR